MRTSNYHQTNNKTVKNNKKQNKSSKTEKNAVKKSKSTGLTFFGLLKSKYVNGLNTRVYLDT